MPDYFFVILLFASLLFHFLFGLVRKQKMKAVLLSSADKKIAEQHLESNIMFSVLTIGACFFISVIYLFIPEWSSLLLPFTGLDSRILDYIGMFLVKISFIANILACLRVTDKFSYEPGELNSEKILAMELSISLNTVLLSAGVFIFISGVISLSFFLLSVCYYAYLKTRK